MWGRRWRLVDWLLVAAALCVLWPATAAAQSGKKGDAPPKAGDSVQSLTLQLNLCPGTGPGACSGIHVYVDTASNHYEPPERYSHCAKDKTSTDFSPLYNGEVLHVHMTAVGGIGSGLCMVDPSSTTWIIHAYRDGNLIERGSFWLGQDYALGSYYAACGKNAPLDPAFEHMVCEKGGDRTLTLSAPGWGPSYPDCPNSSQKYCAIRVHVDSKKPCLSYPLSSFTSSYGLCLGSSDGTSGWFVPVDRLEQLVFASFGWFDAKGEKWSAYVMSLALARVGIIAGTVPRVDSDQFHVKYAKLWPIDPDPTTFLASGDSGPPGAPGGPLLFDFESGRIGADVYMQGFLETKRHFTATEVLEGIPAEVQELPQLAEEGGDQVKSGLRTLFGQLPDLGQ